MSNRLIVASSILAALALATCSGGGGGSSTHEPEPITALFGVVRDSGGTPLSGVSVSGGGATALTDAQGAYVLAASSADQVHVSFQATGYVPTVREVDVRDGSPTATHVALVPEAPAVTMDSTVGGLVDGERGAQAMVVQDSLVDGDGAVVTGMVDVHLTPIDPSVLGEVSAVSGNYRADSGGSTVMLESFGMLDVTIRQDGKKVQIAEGQTMEVQIPAPAGGGTPPDTVALWSFDEESDRWVEEGTATYDQASGTYTATITHMSPWNCDAVAESTCITGLVLDGDGEPLVGAAISTSGIDYSGSSSATTIDDGRFYVAVRKNSQVSVLAQHAEGGGQFREVTSGSADTDIPPTPGDPRCLDVGEWTAERGVVKLADGREVSCNDGSETVFAGTCIEDSYAVFECWAPEGACVYHMGVSPPTVDYANGAEMVMDVGQTGTYHISYNSPDGSLCGTMDSGADQHSSVLSDTNGNSWTFQTPATENDDMVVTCPDGGTVVVTPEERKIWQACSDPTGGGEDGGQCTVEGIPDVPGACDTDADCEGGSICCALPDSLQMCLPSDTCTQIQTQG